MRRGTQGRSVCGQRGGGAAFKGTGEKLCPCLELLCLTKRSTYVEVKIYRMRFLGVRIIVSIVPSVT